MEEVTSARDTSCGGVVAVRSIRCQEHQRVRSITRRWHARGQRAGLSLVIVHVRSITVSGASQYRQCQSRHEAVASV